MRSLGLVLLLARARGAIQGLKGVACVNPMYSNGLDGCVFANDNTREVCWLDLASRAPCERPRVGVHGLGRQENGQLFY